MKFKLVLSFIILAFSVTANFAQTDIQIKKKTKKTIPGMSEKMTPAMSKQLYEMNNTTSTVYLKNSQMRLDSIMKLPNKTGSSFEPVTYSTILQCQKQRVVTFNSRDKKYYQSSMNEQSSSVGKSIKSGGSITVSGIVTDTGERTKIFAYEAKRLKQTIIFTPSANACLKEAMQIDIDGWYADIPEFSCPMKPTLPDNPMGGDCLDAYNFQFKGVVTGVALKEIKKITVDGQNISTLEEEAVELNKTTLADSFFEPPAGYVAANSFNSSPVTTANTTPKTPTTSAPSSSDSLSLPSAGVENAPVGDKEPGMIRIGVVMPKVTTPDSKNNPDAGNDIAIAARNFLVESLKAENVEAIALESDLEIEAKNRNCDYIFYANVTQKRGGGGMFKSMILQGAIMGAGMMVPGIGGMIASTVAGQVMGQTIGKTAKAKDEFILDYQVVGLDKAVLTKANSKKKTEKEGEDVLTPQIQEASKTVLGAIAKKSGK